MKNLKKNIRKIRLITGLGIIDCKKALLKNNCNIKESINYLRKKGSSKAENKFFRSTNQGSIFIKNNENFGVLLEINCETDFVSRDSSFKKIGNFIIQQCFDKKIDNLKTVKNLFNKERIKLISIFGENINFSKYFALEGDYINSYLHSDRIGVLIKSNNNNVKLSKYIAMHIAASNPLYINSIKVPEKIFLEEKKIQMDIAKKFNKPKKILIKIVEGRMKKFIDKICLDKQIFILDSKITVGEYLKNKNFKIKDFCRFEVGQKLII